MAVEKTRSAQRAWASPRSFAVLTVSGLAALSAFACGSSESGGGGAGAGPVGAAGTSTGTGGGSSGANTAGGPSATGGAAGQSSATGGAAGQSSATGGAAGQSSSSGAGGAVGSAGSGGAPAGTAGSAGSGAGGGSAVDGGCGRNPALATGKVWMENICRGVVAVRTGADNFVSWRMFGYEPKTVAFNVYRDATKVNATPITNSTNYVDKAAPAGAKYTVKAVLGGVEQAASEQATPWANNYIDIPLKPPANYNPGDASIGDLDGDGQYEIVLKWEHLPQDNSIAGTTDTVKLEGLEFDGTSKWRIDLGRNIREGAHYTQFLVYDLDGDGDSEIVVKTAPGTVDGTGKNVLLGTDSATADYRNADGYILTGPEYLTIFDGRTGAEIKTVPFEIARGSVSSWGDAYGNRVDRFVGSIAFVTADGRPSALMGRGYYTRATVSAWNYRDNQFSKLWIADSGTNTNYTGQGSHGISIADVDGDDRQDIIYGAAMVKSDGTRGCSTNLGHGDALHVGDFIPSRPGLEVFIPHESGSSVAYSMRDAKTCAIIFQGPANGGVEGPGRGVAADVNPASPGAEAWVNSSTLLNTAGQNAGARPGSSNFLLWWDGDESRELLDGNHVDKFDGARLLTATGCTGNNGSKNTPTLSGDIIGDWREEVMFRCGSNLRLYTTTALTQRRIFTLMHDPQYRAAMSFQQSAYNQPPHPSFHIGNGMVEPPMPNITVR